jgi:hypothetical protein
VKTLAGMFIATSLLVHGSIVRADADDNADTAYKRGARELKAGRIHQACQAFEVSEKLEAKAETELSLADCDEQDGKLVAAARIYRRLADGDPNMDRRKASAAKAAKLEAKAPKLRFAISRQIDGLVLKVDGVVVSSTEDLAVDLGPHEVVATAPGFAGHASPAVDHDRAIVDVIIRMEPRADAAPEPAPAPTTSSAPMAPSESSAPAPMTTSTTTSDDGNVGTDHRKRYGVITGAVGLGLVVGAVVLFAESSSKFNDEHSLCPDHKCASDADVPNANSLQSDGRAYRGVAYGAGIGGILLVAAGTYLFMTAPKEVSHVSLQVSHEGGGLTWTGRF